MHMHEMNVFHSFNRFVISQMTYLENAFFINLKFHSNVHKAQSNKVMSAPFSANLYKSAHMQISMREL